MVAIKASAVDEFLKAASTGVRIALFFGPDTELSQLRARQWLDAIVSEDTGELCSHDGDRLINDPDPLFADLYGQALFDPIRAVVITTGQRSIDGLATRILHDPPHIPVAIIAGDLKKNSGLRRRFETTRNGAAIPSYTPEGRDRVRHVHALAGQCGIEIESEVATLLASIDTLETGTLVSEMEKLGLHAHPETTVRIADVHSIGLLDQEHDTSAEMIDMAFGGQLPDMHHLSNPLMTLFQLRRHAHQLAESSSIRGAGGSPEEQLRPFAPVFYKRKASLQSQIGNWSPPSLHTVIKYVYSAEMELRKRADVGSWLLERTIVRITQTARNVRTRR